MYTLIDNNILENKDSEILELFNLECFFFTFPLSLLTNRCCITFLVGFDLCLARMWELNCNSWRERNPRGDTLFDSLWQGIRKLWSYIIQSGIWDINYYTARNIGCKISYSQEYETQIIIKQRWLDTNFIQTGIWDTHHHIARNMGCKISYS